MTIHIPLTFDFTVSLPAIALFTGVAVYAIIGGGLIALAALFLFDRDFEHDRRVGAVSSIVATLLFVACAVTAASLLSGVPS